MEPDIWIVGYHFIEKKEKTDEGLLSEHDVAENTGKTKSKNSINISSRTSTGGERAKFKEVYNSYK